MRASRISPYRAACTKVVNLKATSGSSRTRKVALDFPFFLCRLRRMLDLIVKNVLMSCRRKVFSHVILWGRRKLKYMYMCDYVLALIFNQDSLSIREGLPTILHATSNHTSIGRGVVWVCYMNLNSGDSHMLFFRKLVPCLSFAVRRSLYSWLPCQNGRVSDSLHPCHFGML